MTSIDIFMFLPKSCMPCVVYVAVLKGIEGGSAIDDICNVYRISYCVVKAVTEWPGSIGYFGTLFMFPYRCKFLLYECLT